MDDNHAEIEPGTRVYVLPYDDVTAFDDKDPWFLLSRGRIFGTPGDYFIVWDGAEVDTREDKPRWKWCTEVHPISGRDRVSDECEHEQWGRWTTDLEQAKRAIVSSLRCLHKWSGQALADVEKVLQKERKERNG